MDTTAVKTSDIDDLATYRGGPKIDKAELIRALVANGHPNRWIAKVVYGLTDDTPIAVWRSRMAYVRVAGHQRRHGGSSLADQRYKAQPQAIEKQRQRMRVYARLYRQRKLAARLAAAQ